MSDSHAHQGFSRFCTRADVYIHRHISHQPSAQEFLRRQTMLDHKPGVLLSCRSEYPGRYQRQDRLVVNPPLSLTAQGNTLIIRALNARGQVLLPVFIRKFSNEPQVQLTRDRNQLTLVKILGADHIDLDERMRTRRSGLFELLRQILSLFA